MTGKDDDIQRNITLPSFPDPEWYSKLDPYKRERLAALTGELKKQRGLSQKVVISLSNGPVGTTTLREAILFFISHMTCLRAASREETVRDDVIQGGGESMGLEKTLLERMYPSDSEDETDGWVSHRWQMLGHSVTETNDLFDFTPAQDDPVETYVSPIRLWDFITKRGIASAAVGQAVEEEEDGWNSRCLVEADFGKPPELNPLLGRLSGLVNGHAEQAPVDKPPPRVHEPFPTKGGSVQRSASTKEKFEKELLPVVLLALDGIPPAIDSLETASTLRKATALNKLLVKITKAGRVRASLDAFISLSCRHDPIQYAFTNAVQSILRYHSAALQELPEAIRKRQQLDAASSIPRQTNVSLIEIALHTEQIQTQLKLLARVCGLEVESKPTNISEKFPIGIDLLSRLYRDLLEADHQSSNMTRYLFCACFRPFYGQMRQWLYTTDDVFDKEVEAKGGIALPDFLKQFELVFYEAGRQLRVLKASETELRIEDAIVQSTERVAEAEAFDASNICQRLDDPWTRTDVDFHQLLLIRHPSLHQTTMPLPFQHNALHEVIDVLSAADHERASEVMRVLGIAKEIGGLKKRSSEAKVLQSLLSRLARMERSRKAALDQAHDYLKQRQELLLEQKASKDALHARHCQERDDRIRLEQEQLKQEALKEHQKAMMQLYREVSMEAGELRDEGAMELDGNENEARSTDASEMAVDSEPVIEKKPGKMWTSPLASSSDDLGDQQVIDMECPVNEVREADPGPSNRPAPGEEVGEEEKTKPVDDSLVPIAAVIDGCVIQPILMQHRCISLAFSEIFCRELEFMKVVHDLKRLYFAESPDFIASFVEKLFAAVLDGIPLNRHVLASLYENSILESAYATLKEPLKTTVHPELISQMAEEERLYDISSQRFINRLNLTTHIPWPLSLVITPSSIDDYNAVFKALLRVRQARWWLDRVWQRFNRTKQHPKLGEDIAIRLRTVRLWYQEASTIVTMLMSYMHHELNRSRWEAFKKAMAMPGLSLVKISDIHQNYLNIALETCFQRSNTRRLRSMMESTLQTIVNFCCVLGEMPENAERHVPVLVCLIRNEDVWDRLQRLSLELKHRLSAFYRTLKYRANRGECTQNLYALMSFNTYFESMTNE